MSETAFGGLTVSVPSKNMCTEPDKAFLVFINGIAAKGKERNKNEGRSRNCPPQNVVTGDDLQGSEYSRVCVNPKPIGVDISPISPRAEGNRYRSEPESI